MGVISDKLKNLQKTYKENNYAEYDQILHFAIEIAEEEENKYCEWHIVDKPNGSISLNVTTRCPLYSLICISVDSIVTIPFIMLHRLSR